MSELVTYSFAVLNAVPHVHTCYRVPVGVIVHSRTVGYLDLKVVLDPEALRALKAGEDIELLSAYLANCKRIACGDAEGGEISLSPPSERFHWLTAPRSDVIQASPVHEGLTSNPSTELERLFGLYVDPAFQVK